MDDNTAASCICSANSLIIIHEARFELFDETEYI